MSLGTGQSRDRGMQGSGPRFRDRWLSFLCVLVLSCGYGALAARTISERAARPVTAQKFLFGDSGAYVGMARDFSSGDFTSRVKSQPYRQPFYPALLAAMIVVRGDAVANLAWVNLLVALATIWVLYLGGRWCLGSAWLGVVGAASYALDPVLWWSVTERLLSEPSYVALALLALGGFLKYIERPRAGFLFLACLAAGATYVARVNGLLLLLAIWGLLLANNLASWAIDRSNHAAQPSAPTLAQIAARFAVAAALGVTIATPTWLPRLVIYGNPVHHGFIGNLPWVDSVREARAKNGAPIGPREYFAQHGLRDIGQRIELGVERVFVAYPLKVRPALYIAGIGGFIASLLTRKRSYALLAVLLLTQMGPLAWISTASPSPRPPNGTMSPFLYAYVAILFSEISRFARSATGERSRAGSAGGQITPAADPADRPGADRAGPGDGPRATPAASPADRHRAGS